MKRFIVTMVITLWAASAYAATWYVDNTATGSNNGTSWANAWKSFSSISGVKPGDTVYISGGASGQTYSVTTAPNYSGTSGNPITYSVGQDAGHNGMVTITGSTGGILIGSGSWVTWNGGVSGVSKMTISGYSYIVNGGGNGIVLKYLTMVGPGTGVHINDWQGVIDCNGCTGYEIANSSIKGFNGCNRIIQGIGSGIDTGYTSNLVHDNYIEIYNSGGGIGDDGFGSVGSISVYNNHIKAINIGSLYTYTQHQDMMQIDDDYLSVYGNWFDSSGQYGFYGDLFSGKGTYAHWRIYNNIFSGNIARAIAIGAEVSAATLNDVIIANNTFVNNEGSIGCGHGSTAMTVSNLYVVNNLAYGDTSDSPIDCTPEGGTPVVSNNTTSNSNIYFVNLSGQDFHLQSNSTAVINKGISPSYLTSVYTTDKDGNARTGIWDIGAYEFGASVTPMPPTSLGVK